MFRKISKNLNKIILKNREYSHNFRSNKQVIPIIKQKRSKYLDNLFLKRIESQIMLEKSKLEFYFEKLQNKNYFRRDYSIFINDNNNSFDVQNANKNKFTKVISLPDISNGKKSSKNRLISKNIKLDNKRIIPNIYKEEINLSCKPNFSNKYVNNKINNKILNKIDQKRFNKIYEYKRKKINGNKNS